MISGLMRIEATFTSLKAKNQSAFIPYIMAGDPDLTTSEAILDGLSKAGADLIELGFPFSDPMAEGPSIQAASERALKAGQTMDKVFAMVSRFRERNQTTPLILMGYLNPIESIGVLAFAQHMKSAGADGLIVVDVPPEEAAPLSKALFDQGLALIRLATPTTDEGRLPQVLEGTCGFVYYVSVNGVTGVKTVDPDQIRAKVQNLRHKANLPVAVGFGIRTEEAASKVAQFADATVVGSALVDVIGESLKENASVCAKVLEKVANLAQSVHQARQVSFPVS
jgi:tryptophan synthase alpha chain